MGALFLSLKFVLVFFPSPIFSMVFKSHLVLAAPQSQTLSSLLQSQPFPYSHPGAGSWTQQGQIQCIVCKHLQCYFRFSFYFGFKLKFCELSLAMLLLCLVISQSVPTIIVCQHLQYYVLILAC